MIIPLWLLYDGLLSYLLEVIAIVILLKVTWNVSKDNQNKLKFTSLDIMSHIHILNYVRRWIVC